MSTVSWTPPKPGDIPAPPLAKVVDIHSHANLLEIKPKHIDIDWTVDWEKRILSGKVTHSIQVTAEGVDQFILDTSFLDIKRVTLAGKELRWSVGKRKGTIGSPLIIELGSRQKGEELEVGIEYSTTKECTALGWLTAEQTESKKTPFLYSQAQAIHGRSMLPCVDSPSHKITYTSKVKSDIPVLMSALAEGSVRATESEPGNAYSNKEGVYRFRQPIGIPTYLIAIVGGSLEFKALAPRVGVWAEPAMIDRAEWEFKHDANRFLEAAEQTISPYSWTRYDCVVLPPSFPYGGMENANLTTLTPSLICGDRSQTDVLLHELAHSWSGNLTSCANWTSFWLNEGINVWIERLLLQVVHGSEAGPAYRGFSYIIGAKALQDALEQFESTKRFQRLVPVFHDGEDPDDAFSSIPYEKGSNFILHLERTVGGLDNFLPFIQSHFKTFYDRSLTTEEWKQHLFDFYAGSPEITKKLNNVDWHGWLHGEGLHLPVKMEYDNSLAVQSQKLADRWISVIEGKKSKEAEKFSLADIEGWDSNQVVVFLEALHSGPRLSTSHVDLLDKTYHFSNQANAEIRLRFYEVALEDPKTTFAELAAKWVSRQGRMKYCRVMYRALNKVKPDLAKRTFAENRSFYHPIAAAMIASDLDGPKRKTLIAVCGSTGTGKSQLAVELAGSLSGHSEIISADSMQLYRGLDVITNKVTEEEMAGIPHHLISFLDPEQDAEYDVGSFVRDARRVIEDMDRKGEKVPIVVGGTTYYLQHLLLPGRLVSIPTDERLEGSCSRQMTLEEVQRRVKEAGCDTLRPDQLNLLHQIVNLSHSSNSIEAEPIEVWTLLQSLDGEMAKRWHFRDRRKILRSIKVLFETGRRHSDLIKEQQEQEEGQCKGGSDSEQGQGDQSTSSLPPRTLIFYLECDRQVLNRRLDARVEKMIDSGLLREINELRAISCLRRESTDYTRGIFQAIGYKEFDAYLQHCEERGDLHSGNTATFRPDPVDDRGVELFNRAVEEMKVATRQFAKRQVGWVRNNLYPDVLKRQSGSTDDVRFYSLDASDLDHWKGNVQERAVGLLQAFLSGTLAPSSPSDGPRGEGLVEVEERDKSFRVCEECTQHPSEPCMVLSSRWEVHANGRSHRASVRRRKGRAGVRAETGPEVEAKRRERQARREGRGTGEDGEGQTSE